MNDGFMGGKEKEKKKKKSKWYAAAFFWVSYKGIFQAISITLDFPFFCVGIVISVIENEISHNGVSSASITSLVGFTPDLNFKIQK